MSSLFLLVGLCLLITHGCIGQKMSFPSVLTYDKPMYSDGNWSVEGTVKLSQSDRVMFESTLEIQTISTLCTLDLNSCVSENVQKSSNICFCHKKSDDSFGIHIGSRARESHNGMLLQAVIPSKPVFKPLSEALIIGNVPFVSPPTPLMDVCLRQSTSLSTLMVTMSDGHHVLCDMATDGGHWTIIQRRVSGDVNFTRGWQEYVDGFGSITQDFWYGLENIHQLCHKVLCQIRIDMKFNDKTYFAKFYSFNVFGTEDDYRMIVSGYSGTAGDNQGFSYHSGMKFSTFDRDNDRNPDANCALAFKGGWWFNYCHRAYLNGVWGSKDTSGLN